MASWTRLLSTSQTAMILADGCFHSPGRSCPREMRPVPMAPMLMRLLGACAPKTEEGTIAGKPEATAAAPSPFAAAVTNARRDCFCLSVMGQL